MLPVSKRIAELLPEHFILYKPRDIVSGDFYFVKEKGSKIFIATVDCTGHGVPGAFMSMIGNELLLEIIDTRCLSSPDLILEQLHQGVRSVLRQDVSKNQDGMDIALCVIDRENNYLNLPVPEIPSITFGINSFAKFREGGFL
ncbi:MAG: SpoIIE family protein phosphatase [Bacteroidia bacterium]|nr:SpoIIE family protein phosphatase [Bacteroidia bacterium]